MLLAVVLAGCGTSALVEPPAFQTEVDTVAAGRTVTITQLRGEILRKLEDGSLVQVAEGEKVSPGEILLVRRGAEFNIGNDTIGAEQHGDRWVKFE